MGQGALGLIAPPDHLRIENRTETNTKTKTNNLLLFAPTQPPDFQSYLQLCNNDDNYWKTISVQKKCLNEIKYHHYAIDHT